MLYLVQYVVSLLGIDFRVVAAPTFNEGGLLPISTDDVREPIPQALIEREESPGPTDVKGDIIWYRS